MPHKASCVLRAVCLDNLLWRKRFRMKCRLTEVWLQKINFTLELLK